MKSKIKIQEEKVKMDNNFQKINIRGKFSIQIIQKKTFSFLLCRMHDILICEGLN